MTDIGAVLLPEIPRLRRYARALTGDATRADDLVEDCLRRAAGVFHLRQTDTEPRAWLFAILHELGSLGSRIESKAPMAVTDETATRVLARQALTLTHLWRALATLSDEQRQVILLVSLEGFRYSDAAKILKWPVGTVRSRLSRGRASLRVAMAVSETAGSSVAA